MSLRTLLRALDAARSASAGELSERLGIPRAAIAAQVGAARRLGIGILGVPGQGYRLAQPLDLLDAGSLQRVLAPAAKRRLSTLEVALEIDSTNSELLRRVSAGAPSGAVLLAEYQGAGRGRRGRAWQSPFAANLYASILWRFAGGPAALEGLSLAAGVAVQRALQRLGAGDTALKWPNDVVAGPRKLAGILVEAGGDGRGACHAVVGVGLNVRMPASHAAALDQPWTDLAALMGPALPARTRVAAALVEELLLALDQFEREGLAPFLAPWAAHDALVGRDIVVAEGATRYLATALGIDAHGRLRVREAGGRERALGSAEVSVRAAVPD